ncbi:MAG TPA: histidine kinase [Opitutaceae bacterium]
MEPVESSPTPLLTDPARRERAKRQLYVACQVIGWGLFTGMQLFFSLAFPERAEPPNVVRLVCLIGMIGAIGLLLSHGARAFIARRQWTHLGWKRLLPRLLLASVVLSALWSALGFGYTYGLLGETWTSKYSPGLSMTLSVVNGAFVYVAWFCLYFFYQLFDRFNRLEVERLSLLASVKEAELRALKAQVNPHFIFNSLNSVRALIDEDPARARQSVTQLANLLRYSLQSGQLETVPFEEELRTVNDYLALEQVRHEERLRLRLDIAPEALRQPVPPMLLQTLVENAVKYGISSRPEGGEIAITARCTDGRLELRVTNPGELSHAARSPSAASTGLGLRNASDRLRLLFGEKATCTLREEPAGTVVALVSMPLDLQVAASLRHIERGRAGAPLVVPATGTPPAEVVR